MNITTEQIKELRERSAAGYMDCKAALIATNGNIDEAIKWLREKGISKAAKKADRIAAEGLVAIAISKNKAVLYEVNSETDFVAKNNQFLELLTLIGESLVNSNVSKVEEALLLDIKGETLEAKIATTIATIGEKITLRRFEVIICNDNETIGAYTHSNNRIAAVVLLEGAITSENAKQVAMHITAMKPKYISRQEMPAEFIKTEIEALTAIAKNEGVAKDKSDLILEKIIQGRLEKSLAEISLVDQSFVVDPNQKVGDFLKANNVNVKTMFRYEVGEGIEKVPHDFVAEVNAQMRK